MNPFKRVCVIVNPISGGKKNKQKIIDYLQTCLNHTGMVVDIKITERRGHATQLANQASEKQMDLVVAIGGDGTMNEVATGLVGRKTVMAMIPLGSGNGLARSLGVPLQFQDAVDLIGEGNITAIDVGKVNEHYFFLLAGIGFDAAVGKRFDEHHSRGPIPYFYLSMQEFLNYKPKKIKLQVDEHYLEIEPFMVTVANGRQFGNNAFVAPQAKLNDGKLNVSILHQLKLHHLPTFLPKVFNGTIDKFSHAEFYTAEKIILERTEPDFINIDGEPVFEAAQITFRIIPGALRMVTPENSPGLC